MASLLVQAFKGAHAELLQEQGALQRLRKLRQLAGVFAAELGTAAGLTPYGLRSLKVKHSVPVAGSAAADASPYGVVLFPAVPYGPKPRHLMDIYVPSHVYGQLQNEQLPLPQQHQQGCQQRHQQGCQQRQQQRCQQQQQQQLAPVVFFCHGGIWATGDRWQFGPMAVSLAQAGAVVVVISYTLYPDALASEMAGEVLAALVWTCQEVARYGGDAARISVVGHSAGGHLAALALMMLAQQRQQALEAAAAAAAATDQQPGGSSRQRQQLQCEQPPVQTIGSSLQPQQQQQQQQGAGLHFQPQQVHARQQQQLGLHQQQQQLLQQQSLAQRRQQQPLWYIIDPLALPHPLLFVGMSSVYDVGLHFEFESMRGVAGVSTMARACGGAAMFDAVSPAVLLKQAAAGRHKAAGVSAAMQPQKRSSQQQLLQPVQRPQLSAGAAAASYHFVAARLGSRSLQGCRRPGRSGFAVTPDHDSSQPQQLLHGEVIPIRIGMQPPPAASSSSSSLASSAAGAPSDTREPSSSSTSSSQDSGDTSFGDAATLLRDFSVADAAQLPPFVVMSSCGDHMVPWHEAADMMLALQACGVPAKHLIYDRYLHNDFVLDWSPALLSRSSAPGVSAFEAAAEHALAAPAAAVAAAAGGGVAEASRAAASGTGDGSSVHSMPAFAQDLISLLTGRVQLQVSCREAAAEAAGAAGKGGAASAGSSSAFRMGRWFAVQPHSRL